MGLDLVLVVVGGKEMETAIVAAPLGEEAIARLAAPVNSSPTGSSRSPRGRGLSIRMENHNGKESHGGLEPLAAWIRP